MHVGLVEVGGEDLDVASPAVYLLLVLHRELDHQGLALVAKGLEAGGHGVETSVLARLDPLTQKQ